MPTDVGADPASFRDPSGQVYDYDGRILRTVTDHHAADFDFVRERGVYDDMVERGWAIAAEIRPTDGAPFATGARYLLEHPRLPFISYPYEWCFEALKAAALLHLDIQIEALGHDVALSDATAYNVQFRGARPIFIDTLSFRRYREGEYWAGQRQFCEQFLAPLLLRAYFGIPHNAWYRGALEGIPLTDFARLLPFRRKVSRNVLSYVTLPARFERAARRGNVKLTGATLNQVKLPRQALESSLKRLRDWIAELAPADGAPTTWQDYASDNSYDSDDTRLKLRFVQDYVQAERPALLWDIGCNTGDYSQGALSAGAGYVIGWDIDQGALSRAFHRARDEALDFTALYLDAANPPPGQGWAEQERRGLLARAPADGVLALALVHHLAIGRNLPLTQVVQWLAALAPSGVVEFVPKEDPMVQQMLELREDIFPDYCWESFSQALEGVADILQVQPVMQRRLVRYRVRRTAG